MLRSSICSTIPNPKDKGTNRKHTQIKTETVTNSGFSFMEISRLKTTYNAQMKNERSVKRSPITVSEEICKLSFNIISKTPKNPVIMLITKIFVGLCR